MNRKKRQTPKPKPVYRWVAVWRCDGELCRSVLMRESRKKCMWEIKTWPHGESRLLRPLRVLITPAKKGAKK